MVEFNLKLNKKMGEKNERKKLFFPLMKKMVIDLQGLENLLQLFFYLCNRNILKMKIILVARKVFGS